jgi:hypothetical protein
LHVGVDAVSGAKDQSLIQTHDQNNWLDKNHKRPLHARTKFNPQRPFVFALKVELDISVGSLLECCLSAGKEDWSKRLSKEEIPYTGIQSTYDGENLRSNRSACI